jgi:hypothetical protein
MPQVVIVGVPFPNFGDAKVQLKRKYQDAMGGFDGFRGRGPRAIAGGCSFIEWPYQCDRCGLLSKVLGLASSRWEVYVFLLGYVLLASHPHPRGTGMCVAGLGEGTWHAYEGAGGGGDSGAL